MQQNLSTTISSQPLRYSVKAALMRYFSNLDGEPGISLYDFVMKEVEGPLLEVVMMHTKGNQSIASKWLGISRGTLRKLLKLHELR